MTQAHYRLNCTVGQGITTDNLFGDGWYKYNYKYMYMYMHM